ncbi:MAG: hypothetical protein KGQ61_02210 [Planctomycetes bacterium]|nr:hypothetical protein [Planctomycetota bacterium]
MFGRIGSYLNAAFSTKWNLLFLGGGIAAAYISGFPGVVLPLLAAGEIYYIASMIGSDRFRSAIDARDARARRQERSAESQQAFDRIRKSLSPELRERFDHLKTHCERLVDLAGSVRGGIDSASLEALDRLLWGHLRMIRGAQSISDFLGHTDELSLRRRIASLEQRLAALPSGNASSTDLRAVLEDDLRTNKARLGNVEEAQRKLAVIVAEVERLESKIAALAESSVTPRDVGDLAKRVDEVAEGMRRTDETMRQIQLPPELDDIEDPPPLLREQA